MSAAIPPNDSVDPVEYTPEQMSEQLACFETILNDRLPYCSGTLSTTKEQLVLFYGKDFDAKRIDFSDASDEQLEHLAKTCEPAAFGVRTRRVLDELYRKAGKLDAEHFSSLFDVMESGLVQVIREQLLTGEKVNSAIRLERYKLNVYGKDSFFKAHKDTPRSKDMFGSLVIVFPTSHEGGTLILRDGEKEWRFDSAKAIKEHDGSCIAYVAFYSDVEHEVTQVNSGYRVTVTYNLYFDAAVPSIPSVALTEDPTHDKLKDILGTLLEDKNFLPDGGYLGFGLRREYPLQSTRDVVDLSEFASYLKGGDAILMSVCEELSLSASLQVYFKTQDSSRDDLDVLCHYVPALARGNSVDDDSLVQHLCEYYGGLRVKTKTDDHTQYYTLPDLYIHWATPMTEFGNVQREYPAYGNEPSIEFAYGCVCLIVAVGPYGERSAVEKIWPLNKKKPVKKAAAPKKTAKRGKGSKSSRAR
ncbi:unnamed protein product [Somion occarium]|uniref:Prolyl 4-hydroxylase alpha subunit Fe(2+) 2OG dioxygenase domain-containing protein n=1 Tax=Somion occarium TaxID=3059160 RepID=A0ABP1E808_9APHY